MTDTERVEGPDGPPVAHADADAEETLARHRASKRASWRMAFWTVGVLISLMAAFALTVEMDWYGFRPRVLILLVFGMVASAALAAGLMAALFHSHRSGLDEESGALPPSADWEERD